MDPLRFAIAAVPIAAWLATLGIVQTRRRPLVVSGSSDLMALGLALSGCVLVGPMALFRPEAATAQFGNFIWLCLMLFYWLWIMLAAMTVRPRIVVYNSSPEQLRSLVATAAAEMDPQFRWAGDSLVLPAAGVQLHIEYFRLLRNTSLVASGSRQQPEGWKQLVNKLRPQTASVTTTPSLSAAIMILLAIALLAVSVLGMIGNPTSVAEALHEMLSFVVTRR